MAGIIIDDVTGVIVNGIGDMATVVIVGMACVSASMN